MDKTKKIILISVISVVVIILIAVGIWLVVRGNNENNGENQLSKIQELYNTLSEKDTYSFKTTVDDNNSSYFAKQGDKSYMEVKIDGETSKYLMMDGNMYYIIDSQEAYYTYTNNQTYLNKIEVQLEALLNMEHGEGREEINNRQYDYEEYGNTASFAIKPFETESSTTRFYFRGDELQYIKTISGEEQETLEVEISDNVDTNLFQLPEGYAEN